MSRMYVCPTCLEWTTEEVCSHRQLAPPMPPTAIRVRTTCGHRVVDRCDCKPWTQPADERPGYAWRNGQRVRVPILRAGATVSGSAMYGWSR